MHGWCWSTWAIKHFIVLSSASVPRTALDHKHGKANTSMFISYLALLTLCQVLKSTRMYLATVEATSCKRWTRPCWSQISHVIYPEFQENMANFQFLVKWCLIFSDNMLQGASYVALTFRMLAYYRVQYPLKCAPVGTTGAHFNRNLHNQW